jgi:membrane-associated phospholipid phosphatase
MVPGPLRRWLLGLVVCIIASLVSIQWVDRPVAVLFQPLRDTTAAYWVNRVLDGLGLALAFAVLFPIGCGLRLAAGKRLASWTAIPLLCSWSTVLGLGAEALFKRIFGRMTPETFLGSQDYGFSLLHGSAVGDAFPSGTAIISVAIATVLWITVPRLRLAVMSAAGFFCVAVILLDEHWLADVIAGGYLGATIGWFTVLVNRAAQSRNS